MRACFKRRLLVSLTHSVRSWVKPEPPSKAAAVLKWVPAGAPCSCERLIFANAKRKTPAADELSDEARLEQRLAKRRKYEPLRVAPVEDLASYLPAPDAGWGEARRETAAVTAPEAPRRSTRARADRGTYVDGAQSRLCCAFASHLLQGRTRTSWSAVRRSRDAIFA